MLETHLRQAPVTPILPGQFVLVVGSDAYRFPPIIAQDPRVVFWSSTDGTDRWLRSAVPFGTTQILLTRHIGHPLFHKLKDIANKRRINFDHRIMSSGVLRVRLAELLDLDLSTVPDNPPDPRFVEDDSPPVTKEEAPPVTAKPQLARGAFQPWIKQHFSLQGDESISAAIRRLWPTARDATPGATDKHLSTFQAGCFYFAQQAGIASSNAMSKRAAERNQNRVKPATPLPAAPAQAPVLPLAPATETTTVGKMIDDTVTALHMAVESLQQAKARIVELEIKDRDRRAKLRELIDG